MWSLYATGDPVVDIMNKYKKIMPSVGVPPKSYTIQTLNNEATDFGNKFSNSKATITIYGGTFVNYDPSNSKTENPVADFVADGYTVEVSDNDGNPLYTVVPVTEDAE